MKREAAQKRDLATLKKATSVHGKLILFKLFFFIFQVIIHKIAELETMTKKQGVVVVDGLSDIGKHEQDQFNEYR